jgi:microcystin-dependent protein
MSDAFVGEIRQFGFNFAPTGWAQCNGQLIAISQNTALFSLLGTTYGGNGTTTFALPNLQGRVPLQAGQAPGLSNRDLGEMGGAEAVTLLTNQTPGHFHPAFCNSGDGNDYGPAGNFWAQDVGGGLEYDNTGGGQMAAGAVGISGGGVPHSNLQPYQVLNYCIALRGIFPPRS